MKLLTPAASNAKIAKSIAKYKWNAGILHLLPHKLSGRNLCPCASKGCAAACLNTSGFGRYASVQEARLRRTNFFFERRQEFFDKLTHEIGLLTNKGKTCIRLNGTSDLKWEEIFPNLFSDFPQVQFYDYTKIEKRMLYYLSGGLPSNYHLTFSRSENNDIKCENVLKSGGSVAVVFRTLPKRWKGFQVINGDIHDFRFLDPVNVVVGLIPKGKAKFDRTGFVI